MGLLGGLTFDLGIFWGFVGKPWGFLPPIDHLRQLKSRVPPRKAYCLPIFLE